MYFKSGLFAGRAGHCYSNKKMSSIKREKGTTYSWKISLSYLFVVKVSMTCIYCITPASPYHHWLFFGACSANRDSSVKTILLHCVIVHFPGNLMHLSEKRTRSRKSCRLAVILALCSLTWLTLLSRFFVSESSQGTELTELANGEICHPSSKYSSSYPDLVFWSAASLPKPVETQPHSRLVYFQSLSHLLWERSDS